MSGAADVPGHAPADPRGYTITEIDGGFVWVRRADDHRSGPYRTRREAVDSAEADRPATGGTGAADR